MHHLKTAMLTAALALAAKTSLAAPECYPLFGTTKPNKLYLYFPTVADATYPEFGTPIGVPATSPAHAFDISDLTSYGGTTSQLRDGIYDVVADTYCEFNVEVIKTTSAPAAIFPRRNTVAITTDDGTAANGLFGLAQNVDTGDATPIDFGYVWGATYQGLFGGPGGELNGANSTVQRWARALGGTASHEAGHNYGLSHSDGLVLAPGEDLLVHHLMAKGSNYSGEDRAGYRRHFSDHEYSVLAANVGLSVATIWNWDFINPNAQAAKSVQIDFLSTQPALSIASPYNGSQSPWVNPTVSAALGTQMFNGLTYNRFRVTWSVGHAWAGHTPDGPGPAVGLSGEVAGGASFHVGTAFNGVNFNTPASVIITNVTLFDAANTPLALHPRALGFDSGAADAADGTFNIQAANVAGTPVQLASVNLQLLPRLLSIDSMVSGEPRMLDVHGEPVSAWSEPQSIRLGATLQRGEALKFPIARLSDQRHVVERVTRDCNRADRLSGPDTPSCRPGINIDLFPATTAYLAATVVDPKVKYWDYRRQAYVTGPLTSHMFLQVVGHHPDLNRNGTDDYLDILTGRSRDENGDGVPDEISGTSGR